MQKGDKKVLVGMSGGVDSAAAVWLLQKAGYEVSGLFIDFIGGEKSERDFEKAQKVADKLNVPICKFDAQKEFKEKIIDKFVADYEAGITPNPCVICNPEMKFKILIEEADKFGIDKIATGHYARVRELKIKNEKLKIKEELTKNQSTNCKLQITGYRLLIACDSNKDQSYFLYRLNQTQLKRIVFPLGEYLKTEVRQIAQKNNFELRDEKESQDICFIPDNDFKKFIGQKIRNKSGEIVDKSGGKLGEHDGLHFYTIGQRKGINLGGDGPYYVIKKDQDKNQLVVSNNPEDLNCPDNSFKMGEVNWISPDLKFPLESKVKVRYHNSQEYAIITEENPGFYKVRFKKNQKAVTPGQSAVFYGDDGEVLGGGIII
ncbi:MAG: tRNA 2-thiouridine(34) synthase MnmA [Candidatus Moraniibacteriota bacterium]